MDQLSNKPVATVFRSSRSVQTPWGVQYRSHVWYFRTYTDAVKFATKWKA